MKEERGVVIVAGRSMAVVSPTFSVSPAQPLPLPTPSPFSFSVASTAWSSRPPIHVSNLFLRSLALLFSFVSALALVASPATPEKVKGRTYSSFHDYPEFMYCFIVHILAFLYSAYQLFKGICDIAHRGILISEMTSDYISFILDQMAGYLIISSSSVTVLAIQQMDSSVSLWKAAVVSVCMSFATFLVIAACALLSGYKLCKRIVW